MYSNPSKKEIRELQANQMFKKYGKLYIGEKPVQIKKIAITQWKKLFNETIDILPMLIVNLINTPQENRINYLTATIDRFLDDAVSIVSELTGIEVEYIHENCSLDQLLEYFVQMAKLNDFSGVVKNFKSVLSLSLSDMMKSLVTKDENAEKQ